MVDKTDYNRKRTNLNEYIPLALRNELSESIVENLFNRHLTKSELNRKVGIIGNADEFSNSDQRLPEKSLFDKNNQLQPIPQVKIGNVDYFLPFNEFLNRLDNLGVNIDRFNEWGNSLQFNWVPPIDIDKLINYRNYYWDDQSTNSVPEYITIKNKANWAKARFSQLKKSLYSTIPSISVEITSSDKLNISSSEVDSNTLKNGDSIILRRNTGEFVLDYIKSVTFSQSSLNYIVELEFNSPQSLQVDSFILTKVDIDNTSETNNTITFNGEYSEIIKENYIVALTDSQSGEPTMLSSVNEVLEDAGSTTIKLEVSLIGLDYEKVSFLPLISLANGQSRKLNQEIPLSFIEEWNDFYMGDIIWGRDYLVKDLSSDGRTELGLNNLYDNTTNFQAEDVRIGDELIIKSGKSKGEYPIISVEPTVIGIPENNRFFTQVGIDYFVTRKAPISSIRSDSAPMSASQYEFWYDTSSGALKQYLGGSWEVVVKNFKVLVDYTEKKYVLDLEQNDDWSKSNKWVHKNQITEFTGKTRADLPIIEFEPFLELSSSSAQIGDWTYRASSRETFYPVDVEPNLFELIDLSISNSSANSNEFQFKDHNTVSLNESFGNLVNEIEIGQTILFKFFNYNNGTYTVKDVRYVQPAPNKRFITEIELEEDIVDPFDLPTAAKITPEKTSLGDDFVFGRVHWCYNGVKDITASSFQGEKNPMLDSFINSSITFPYERNTGLYWESFSIPSNGQSITSPEFILSNRLHDIVLYDEYQEGDIRVYINGERQYGNFVEIESPNQEGYVGSIKMDPDVTITDKDFVRIELGPYYSEDVGRGSIIVKTNKSNSEPASIVKHRRVEQSKTSINQYPKFSVYDINKNPLDRASEIFKFRESRDYPVDSNILRRIVKPSTDDYGFEQDLLGDNGEILLYKNNETPNISFQSIWKHGPNSEQYVPIKNEEGDWKLPNQWYYNVEHKNKRDINFKNIFTHFRSIIKSQNTPGLLNGRRSSFYVDNEVNLGLGGRIKEHNDGFDLLISSVFNRNVSPVSLLEFSAKQYDYFIDVAFNEFSSSINKVLTINQSDISSLSFEYMKDYFENQDKFKEWYGDSTTFNGDSGIKNLIPTLANLGVIKPSFPVKIIDSSLDINKVKSHNGHYIDTKINTLVLNKILEKIKKDDKTIVINSTESLPITFNGRGLQTGDVVVRESGEVYRYDQGWENVDLQELFTDVIYNFELSLYNAIKDEYKEADYSPKFDLDSVNGDQDYEAQYRNRFNTYTKSNNVKFPFYNNNFNSQDPFTWNYSNTEINVSPVTGSSYFPENGYWKSLYKEIYNTFYPHLEPWRLQGYYSKPSWWDSEYSGSSRMWTENMWNNIIDGVVPSGENLPDGSVSSGSASEVTSYLYVPVNIEDAPTLDGYQPDEILPPYWDSNNTTNIRIGTPYDKDGGFIKSPQSDFELMSGGIIEQMWQESVYFNYDKSIIAFLIQPLRFLNKTFDSDYILIDCLQVDKDTQKVYSHEDIIFHGDVIDNKEYISYGLNQLYVQYNRYYNFDGKASLFRDFWVDWEPKLSYNFNGLIDTRSFDISNKIIDITNKDYSIKINNSEGNDKSVIDSLTANILSIPSRFDPQRINGLGWTFELATNSPLSDEINAYAPMSYYFRKINSTDFRINSFELIGAGISDSRAYQRIRTNVNSTLTEDSGLINGSTYSADITFDNLNTVNVIITPTKNNYKLSDLVSEINSQISDYGFISLENNDIYIFSNDTTNASSVSISDMGLFATITGFQSIDSVQTSNVEFQKYFIIDGNFTNLIEDNIKIDDSSQFNGTYTVEKTIYDISSKTTRIYVLEDVNVTNPELIDGNIELVDGLSLPFETGDEVYLSSDMFLPSPLTDTRPYYIIINDDFEFSLAESKNLAEKKISISTASSGSGDFYVSKLVRTFKALGGSRVDAEWRVHEVDKRKTRDLSLGSVISGVQNFVDVIVGYSEYLYDQGFEFLRDENNYTDDGYVSDWQYTIEKLIDDAFLLRSLDQADNPIFDAEINSDELKLTGGPYVESGTEVIFDSESTQLPSNISLDTSYYAIRTNTRGVIKLALSVFDAVRGKSIEFSDSGSGLKLKVNVIKPKTAMFELNPFYKNLWIKHPRGVLANIYDGNKMDSISNQIVYDLDNNIIDKGKINVIRNDKSSRISLTNQTMDLYPEFGIGGARLFTNYYSHIISFNNYSTTNSLMYDSFLGLRTPRFYTEFNINDDESSRPSVGGFVLNNGNELVQNLESLTDDLRYYYDTYKVVEGKTTTNELYKQLGYEGRKDYFDDLNINSKSQFNFWRGFIQNKGTNFSINAFINQPIFQNTVIDEFWAYKLAEFGDSKPKYYPEVKLYSRDSVKKELRIEFSPETGGLNTEGFEKVSLTNRDRWWNQPDQIFDIDKNLSDESFYFSTRVLEKFDNFYDQLENSNGIDYLELNYPSDAAVITYKDSNDNIKSLVEGHDYVFVNSFTIEFKPISNIGSLNELKLRTLTYNYDAQTPFRVINRDSKLSVKDIQIFNPILEQYYKISNYVFDIKSNSDPAKYSKLIDSENETGYWGKEKVDTVWFDSSKEYYLPYFDKQVTPNIDNRISDWGKLSEFGDIGLYMWTESDLTPEEWDVRSESENEDESIPLQNRITGRVYKELYKNTNTQESPVWERVSDEIETFNKLNVDTVTLTGVVEFYSNGKFVESIDLDSINLEAYVSGYYNGDYLALVKRKPVPTQEQIDNLEYQFYTPHTVYRFRNKVTGEIQEKYYFWVRNKKQLIDINGSNTGGKVSLERAEQQMKHIPESHAIIQGIVGEDDGYGIVFGGIFDGERFDLPYRYSQVIIKGMEGIVRDNENYTLQVTQDFSLRSNYNEDDLSLKNVHEEWKLIRKLQPSKIDKYLWDRITESIIGFEYDGESFDTNKEVPTPERVLYDELYDKNTRFGLGEETALTTRSLAISTITELLTSNEVNLNTIDIDSFLTQNTFDSIESSIETMNGIYNTFPTEIVNFIFFEILEDALTLKEEYKNILKTSWVALNVTQNVQKPEVSDFESIIELQNDGDCVIPEIDDEFIETPLPSPSSTPSPTPSVTASITPSPTQTLPVTPTTTTTPTPTPTPSPSASQTQTPTPTPTNTPTPSVTSTPSVTPSETPVPSESPTPSVTASPTPTTTQSLSPTPTPTPSTTPSQGAATLTANYTTNSTCPGSGSLTNELDPCTVEDTQFDIVLNPSFTENNTTGPYDWQWTALAGDDGGSAQTATSGTDSTSLDIPNLTVRYTEADMNGGRIRVRWQLQITSQDPVSDSTVNDYWLEIIPPSPTPTSTGTPTPTPTSSDTPTPTPSTTPSSTVNYLQSGGVDGATFNAFNDEPDTPGVSRTARFRLNTDYTIDATDTNGIYQNTGAVWLGGSPPGGISGDYEVRFTQTSTNGTITGDSNPATTFTSLSTSKELTVTGETSSNTTATYDVEIREIANTSNIVQGTVQFSMNI